MYKYINNDYVIIYFIEIILCNMIVKKLLFLPWLQNIYIH